MQISTREDDLQCSFFFRMFLELFIHLSFYSPLHSPISYENKAKNLLEILMKRRKQEAATS